MSPSKYRYHLVGDEQHQLHMTLPLSFTTFINTLGDESSKKFGSSSVRLEAVSLKELFTNCRTGRTIPLSRRT